MSQTIKLKRGLSTNIGSVTLQAGEPAFCTDTYDFYIGDGTTNRKINGSASTANALTTARTISLTGDVTGSVSFDGSANVSMTTTEANSGVTAGTYKSVTVDAKGRVTAGTNPTTVSGYGITDAITTAGGQTIAGALTVSGGVAGNASTSTKLATARTIAISGDVTGTATSFDGSANITITATVPTIDGGTF